MSPNRQLLYTFQDAWTAWRSGAKFPIAFFGDSTFDGAATTGWVRNTIGADNDSPNAFSRKLEGLLRDSGALLLHDDLLWGIVDGWVGGLADDTFRQTLPLIRRTFATFAAVERRQMGERARRGPARPAPAASQADETIDLARAEAALPLVARLLGLGQGPLTPR